MIAPSAIWQSWARWQRAISMQPRPTRVSPPSFAARCTVTYSRITLSSPIVTKAGTGAWPRIWGAPPSTACGATWTRRPRRQPPWSTAWAPTAEPSPTTTSASITTNGPTVTSTPSCAFRSTIAEGWIVTARSSRRARGGGLRRRGVGSSRVALQKAHEEVGHRLHLADLDELAGGVRLLHGAGTDDHAGDPALGEDPRVGGEGHRRRLGGGPPPPQRPP